MERTEPRAVQAGSYASQATDQRATYLRIYADANGETLMQDIDISLLPREIFKGLSPVAPFEHIGRSSSHNSMPSPSSSPNMRASWLHEVRDGNSASTA